MLASRSLLHVSVILPGYVSASCRTNDIAPNTTEVRLPSCCLLLTISHALKASSVLTYSSSCHLPQLVLMRSGSVEEHR